MASGLTPKQLARSIEQQLSKYIKDPFVTVTVRQFVGRLNDQIRVVGEASTPRALSYKTDLTLLDVMIVVGGLTEFAAGNRATIVRTVNGKQKQIPVRLESLLKDGDITANVSMLPGDIVIIPESWF
jgi:polysaccharide export outer membrane protein